MADCDTLLAAARNNPRGLRFGDLVALAECWGFRERKSRGGGSHRVMKREGTFQLMNFQTTTGGMAKPYQVRQLLIAIDEIIATANKRAALEPDATDDGPSAPPRKKPK